MQIINNNLQCIQIMYLLLLVHAYEFVMIVEVFLHPVGSHRITARREDTVVDSLIRT